MAKQENKRTGLKSDERYTYLSFATVTVERYSIISWLQRPYYQLHIYSVASLTLR